MDLKIRKAGSRFDRSRRKLARRVATVYLLGCFGYGLIFLKSPAVARQAMQPTSDSSAVRDWWSRIEKADTRINACRVTWKRVLFINAKKNINVEKQAARAREQAIQAGKSATEADKAEQWTRNLAQNDARDNKIESTLTFVRSGATIRCDVAQMFGAKIGLRYVEFYDGTNAVLIRTEVQGIKENPPTGYLRHDDKEILSHSAATWLLPRFLTGLPLSQEISAANPTFSKSNTHLRETANDELVLERKAPPSSSPAGQKYPALFRLTLSKEHLRPISYESLNLLYAENEVGRSVGRVSATDYSLHRGGIWFPSKVTIATPGFTVEYTLVKAAFNEAVDPAELRLPANTFMGDLRFPKEATSYTLKNGLIPSDEEVRKMLNIERTEAKASGQAATEAKNEEIKHLSALPVTPAIGLLFMALGGVLWGRSRKADKT